MDSSMWIGPVIAVVVIVIVFGSFLPFIPMMLRLFRGNPDTQRILTTGIPARAMILQVQMGSMTVTVGVQRNLQLQITALVHPPNGQPYQVMVTDMISELQVPQVQPGAWMQVRIDPMNPQKVAIEATGVQPGAMPGQAPYGAAAQFPNVPYGMQGAPVAPAPQYGYAGQPQGAFAPPQTPAAYGPPGAYAPQGMAGMPMGTPVRSLKMPLGAKIGLAIGALSLVGGLGVTVAVVAIPMMMGPSDDCARAAKCCRAAAGGIATAEKACDNFKSGFGPSGGSACKDAADQFEKSAKAFGRTCK